MVERDGFKMRALLQRVAWAKVRGGQSEVVSIGPGLLVFLACLEGDEESDADALAQKVAEYRIFSDSEGRTNLSVQESEGEVLVISQFTLAADTRKGRRPSFSPALEPDRAKELVNRFSSGLVDKVSRVAQGFFGEEMEVELLNRGPATYFLEYPCASS